MNDQETSQILELISAAWPKNPLPAKTAVLYGTMLSDFSFRETYAAVKQMICESKFTPSIAEIRRHVIETRCGLPEPQQAWVLVCMRYGHVRGGGDRNITLAPVVIAALDAAAIDAHRLHTTENRHWLKQAFLDVYTVMREDSLKWENEGSRLLGERGTDDGDARMGLDLGVDAPLPARLPLPTHAGNSGGGDEPARV